MQYTKEWEIVKELPSGKQGKTSLVRKKRPRFTKASLDDTLFNNLLSSLEDLTSPQTRPPIKRAAFANFTRIVQIISDEELEAKDRGFAVLKELLLDSQMDDAKNSPERIRREIEAMYRLDGHPHILRVLAAKPEEGWYISEYQSGGNLLESPIRSQLKANALASLTAFRQIVDATSHVHRNGMVHRDIKPANIFVKADGSLVLGDFGIVHDPELSRLTEHLIGSRDWMAPWLQKPHRIDDIKPAADVFSLGKVLWAMVSGKNSLPFWYFEDEDHPDFNLTNIFPNVQEMEIINRILRMCIVEKEKECLTDASVLLQRLNVFIQVIETHGEINFQSEDRKCRVCSLGTYSRLADGDLTRVKDFGFSQTERKFKIFVCRYCGNIQLFSTLDGHFPAAWK